MPLIAPELLGEIVATASDIVIVVSETGTVQSLLMNPSQKSFGQLDHWVGYDLREFLMPDSVQKLDMQLAAIEAGADKLRPLELNHVDNAKWEFPIRYTFHPISPDGAILMLGRDLRPIAEVQQQLIKAQLALERDYEQQREYDTRYRVLMETTLEAMVFVSMGSGRITDLNSSAALLLGGGRDELLGAAFAQEFEGRKRNEFMESLTSVAYSDAGTPVELQARRSRRRLLLHPTFFRAAGERILLCRFEKPEDKSALTEDLGANLGGLFSAGADAILFTDREGTISAANDSFLGLVDAAHLTMVKGRSLGDFLARGSIDLKAMIEGATRTGQMRLFSTRLSSEYGSQISVEISATYLTDRTNPSMVFVIRDVSRVENVRAAPASTGNAEQVRSVMEMVGSATLKAIVAETTDVVEKMCIETAVELTRNNRVAAAEMLGLSRQSLYVKLRKYGLLAKGDEI